MPALFNLDSKGSSPERFLKIGFPMSSFSDEQYTEFTWKGVQELCDLRVRTWSLADRADCNLRVGGLLSIFIDHEEIQANNQHAIAASVQALFCGGGENDVSTMC